MLGWNNMFMHILSLNLKRSLKRKKKKNLKNLPLPSQLKSKNHQEVIPKRRKEVCLISQEQHQP